MSRISESWFRRSEIRLLGVRIWCIQAFRTPLVKSIFRAANFVGLLCSHSCKETLQMRKYTRADPKYSLRDKVVPGSGGDESFESRLHFGGILNTASTITHPLRILTTSSRIHLEFPIKSLSSLPREELSSSDILIHYLLKEDELTRR